MIFDIWIIQWNKNTKNAILSISGRLIQPCTYCAGIDTHRHHTVLFIISSEGLWSNIDTNFKVVLSIATTSVSWCEEIVELINCRAMHKTKVDFEIPIDIKHDLVYCQRALTTHILMHQVSSRRGEIVQTK